MTEKEIVEWIWQEAAAKLPLDSHGCAYTVPKYLVPEHLRMAARRVTLRVLRSEIDYTTATPAALKALNHIPIEDGPPILGNRGPSWCFATGLGAYKDHPYQRFGGILDQIEKGPPQNLIDRLTEPL